MKKIITLTIILFILMIVSVYLDTKISKIPKVSIPPPSAETIQESELTSVSFEPGSTEKPMSKQLIKNENQQETQDRPGEIKGTEINYQNVFNGINQERYKLGLNLLKRSKVLDKVAEDFLNDIIKYNYWDHKNPVTGTTFATWFALEGYVPFKFAGQILARDFLTVQDMISAWMRSPTHKGRITRTEYKETGIAIKGSLVVQVFGVKGEIK